ncbi:MAG: hypothetical protein K6L73_07385 [Cellvibrionaceae bacterium]
MNLQNKIQCICNTHQQKALDSPYDAKVAIIAIGVAEESVRAIDTALPDEQYLDAVIKALTNLQARYDDKSGEYTSGKAEIGSLLSDIKLIAKGENSLLTQDTRAADAYGLKVPDSKALDSVIKKVVVPLLVYGFICFLLIQFDVL